jgi:hypothetical protein
MGRVNSPPLQFGPFLRQLSFNQHRTFGRQNRIGPHNRYSLPGAKIPPEAARGLL